MPFWVGLIFGWFVGCFDLVGWLIDLVGFFSFFLEDEAAVPKSKYLCFQY